MSAYYHGEIVRVYATRGDRTQIATRRGLRWVKTSELEAPCTWPPLRQKPKTRARN